MISTGQVSVGTAPASLCRVPPGPCSVVITNLGTAAAYVGAGTAVTSTNGMPVPSGIAVPFAGLMGNAGSPVSACTAAGSATLGFLISTSTGQTGP